MGKQHFFASTKLFFLNMKIWHSRYFKHGLRSGEHISINILHFWPPPCELGSIWQKSQKSQKSWKIRFFQKIAIFLKCFKSRKIMIYGLKWLPQVLKNDLGPILSIYHTSGPFLGKSIFCHFWTLKKKKFQFCWCEFWRFGRISAKNH